eukprot:TRINITY_DN8842_c0_g1_i14.p1 TRINITY_DN8842_c0_g1~~TRINITY_DN8842_c0_g1_i14.p1  ORF type:complete len:1185 (+),score=294.49 TRINITY_DN8842_c0_g1_i14:370-3555(+)
MSQKLSPNVPASLKPSSPALMASPSSPQAKSPLSGSPLSSREVSDFSLDEKKDMKRPVAVRQPEESLSQWEDRILSEICQFTVSQSKQTAGRYIFLPGCASEIPPDTPALLNRDNLDSAFLERFSLPFQEHVPPFSYLLGCYQRALAQLESLEKQDRELAKKTELLQSVLDSCVSYSGMLLLDVAILSAQEQLQSRRVLQRLIEADPTISKTLPKDFLKKLVQKFDGEGLQDLFQPIIQQITSILRVPEGKDPNEHDLPLNIQTVHNPLRGLATLAVHLPLAQMIVALPQWLPNIRRGRDIETLSLLGPAFGLSTDYARAREKAFIQVQRHNGRFIQSEMDEHLGHLKREVANVQQGCFRVVNNLMRVNAGVRERCLEWMSEAMRWNQQRSKMQFDANSAATDGFFLNLSYTMLMLCKPVVDAKQEKMGLVDLQYLIGGAKTRVDYSSLSRVSATKEEIANLKQAEQKYAEENNGPRSFNFVTEIFFMTLNCLHIGLNRSITLYLQLLREIHKRQAQLERLDAENPRLKPMIEQEKARVHGMIAQSLCISAHVLHPELLKMAATFYEWTAQFFLRNLSENSPLLGLLPEHIVENIVDFFAFLGDFSRSTVRGEGQKWDGLLLFCVQCMQRQAVEIDRTAVGELLVLGQGALIKNPHLRSKLAEVLCLFLPPKDSVRKFERDHPFNTHPLLQETLIPALLKLYCDVEYTGRHAQFYEKFEPRERITQVLHYLWEYPAHRATLERISRQPGEFSKFINMVLNDSVFLLDESLKYLAKIREEQVAMENQEAWNAQPEEVRREREGALVSTEGSTRWMMHLANSTFSLLVTLCRHLTHAFVSEEFAERMAHMLDYYIVTLCGPKVTELKVNNPEKYSFNPRNLLRDILLIFISCSSSREFLSAVAQDERSYQPAVFAKAIQLVRSKMMLSPAEVGEMQTAMSQIQKLADELREAQLLDDEDIPAEFLDPITQAIMKDPVKLPCGVVADRPVIVRHLFSSPTDPFTQLPLRADQLVPESELKHQIDDFVAERLNRKKRQTEDERKVPEENASPVVSQVSTDSNQMS